MNEKQKERLVKVLRINLSLPVEVKNRQMDLILEDLEGDEDEPSFDELVNPHANASGTAKEICQVAEEIRDLLIQKNNAYGDSALNPQRIFSKSDSMEQIRVRIDDKLNRIKHGNAKDPFSEDVELDLLGYLILHRIARKRKSKNEAPAYPFHPTDIQSDSSATGDD